MEVIIIIILGASRISYEKTLNPVWRHGRKLLPFGLIIAGLMYTDVKLGIIWFKYIINNLLKIIIYVNIHKKNRLVSIIIKMFKYEKKIKIKIIIIKFFWN